MNLKRILMIGATAAGVVAMTTGGANSCQSQGGNVVQTFDGTRIITTSMAGIWHASGGTGCSWKVRNPKNDRLVFSGPNKKHPEWAQSLVVSPGMNGLKWTSSHCGTWTKK